MRRVVVLLLALVLVPSMATASWYRCALDGKTRAVCCCPARSDSPRKAPTHHAVLREACCCTVTQVAARASTGEPAPAVSIGVAPVATVLAAAIPAPRVLAPIASLDRPRAPSDPPDTLFARRCSLLL
ncbi:MAG TPA: hypothetical protein VHW23_33465 [Kofleriaceae bacterium]|nr:hypothetical protein [Kofleriaceae bacterium]